MRFSFGKTPNQLNVHLKVFKKNGLKEAEKKKGRRSRVRHP
jgi:DNA-binding transcriptional ArsR family regulator